VVPLQSFELTVNGRHHVVETLPDTPLLWVLRDEIGLTGTKYGCGEGLCGSCTVLLDGEAIWSCVTPISEIGGAEVRTIEGLSPDGSHPVQRAWLVEDVPQCGYCQTGQIMAAVALLRRAPSPTEREIDQAMRGNICRCGTYARIQRAVRRAAELAREERA
jgi:aerobic-type carbon monoxide dehydrogenase small subunit (CoxS/CutS family)